MVVDTNTKMVVSPDDKKILLWTDLSTVQLFDTTLNLLGSHVPPSLPPKFTTRIITFSQDSSLALLETDTHNPIAVLNTADMSLVHSITVP